MDVDYFDNPKVVAAGRDGRDLHLASICWVGRFLTDGVIPRDAIQGIANTAAVSGQARRWAIGRLVAAGLWLPTDDGFVLHDFVEMNGSRADWERRADQYRIRQRRYRERHQANGHDA